MYTYILGWTHHNKWYYGVRTANKVEPEMDLGVVYFSSSKFVKRFIKKNGKPDFYQIRRKFNNRESAVRWEYKVLRRMNVVKSDIWLNMHDSPCPPTFRGSDNGFYGKTHTDEKKAYWSIIRKGRKHSEETLKKKREQVPWNKGIPRSEESTRKRNETLSKQPKKPAWNKGIPHSEEHKHKLRKPKKIKHPCTEEKRKKISVARVGKKWYHDSVTKHCVCCYPEKKPHNYISGLIKKGNGLLGKQLSEETKRKMSITIRKNRMLAQESLYDGNAEPESSKH